MNNHTEAVGVCTKCKPVQFHCLIIFAGRFHVGSRMLWNFSKCSKDIKTRSFWLPLYRNETPQTLTSNDIRKNCKLNLYESLQMERNIIQRRIILEMFGIKSYAKELDECN